MSVKESFCAREWASRQVPQGANRRGTGGEEQERRSTGMTEQLRAGVLFDVDGTLVDTNYLHALAWSRAFRDAGEWAPMNAIHRLIGMGGDRLVTELLGHECAAAVEARPHHYKELAEDICVFPQAAALYAPCTNTGWRSCWPHPRRLTNSRCSVRRSTLTTSSMVRRHRTTSRTPNRHRSLRDCDEDFRYRPSILAVGDSIWDVQAARAAGIGCLSVESGGFSQHELSEAGSRQVYRDVAEILDQLYTGPLGQLVSRS